MKTKLFLTMVAISLFATSLLNAQNISLYYVGNDTTGGQTVNNTFFKVDGFSGSATIINTLPEVYGKTQGSSTFNNGNNHYLFFGTDSNYIKRLYTIDTTGNIIYNPAISNYLIYGLQYDFKTQNTYGFVKDTSTGFNYFALINTNTGNVNLINQLNDIMGISLGCVTFNSNSGKYILYGPGPGGAVDHRLFIINAQTGIIENNILANDCYLGLLAFDVVHNKLLGLYRDTTNVDLSYFAVIDTVTANVTILDTMNYLAGYTSGSQVFDQASGTFIFIGTDTSQIKRLYMINVLTGQVISDAPISNIICDIECDNTKFSKGFYTNIQEEKPIFNDLSIYPNPASEKFNLEFTVSNPQDISIRVVNSLGQIVYRESQKNYQGKYSGNIDTRSFATGVYVLNIKVGENTRTENITVVH